MTSTNDQVNLTTTTEDSSQAGTQDAHTGDYHEDFNTYDQATTMKILILTMIRQWSVLTGSMGIH